MARIKNAAPIFIALGVSDQSMATVMPSSEPLPQHLPLFYIMGMKGPSTRNITSASKLIPTYGLDTFDEYEKWYNHSTRYLMSAAGTGNTCMVHRLVPDDATKANVALYLDVMPTQVPNYLRDSLGALVIDSVTGDYKVDVTTPTIPGYEIKYVTESQPVLGTKGTLTSKPGTMSREIANDDVELTFSTDVSSDFTVGETITGSTSSATGIVESKIYDVAVGTKVVLNTVVGTFQSSETVITPSITTTDTISSIDTELTDPVRSTMYPIIEAMATEKGASYNNIGFSISSLLEDDVEQDILDETSSLPYNLTIVGRANKGSSGVIKKSLFGEQSVQFSMKPNVVNPLSETMMDIDLNKWYNEDNPLLPYIPSDIEDIYIYNDILEQIHTMFMTVEQPHISATPVMREDGVEEASLEWYDYSSDDPAVLAEEGYLMNIFSCTSTQNVRYNAIVRSDKVSTHLDPNQTEVDMGINTPIYLGSGLDGTINNTVFEELVVREMDKYADSESEYQDLAINPESILYDSGFTLDTKKSLVNFITLRKDTNLVLSTHDAAMGTKDLPLSSARGVGLALQSRLKFAPESDYYGTSVMRCIITVGTGLLADGSTKDRIPLTFEILSKSCEMMGAGNGDWKAIKVFDKAPNNILNKLISINPSFIPSGIKPTIWNDGLVWAQPFDRDQFHFPGLQTVYTDDTSVLNSFFTAMACGTLVKIAAETWRNFTGSVALTEAEFVDAVTNFTSTRLQNRFGGMFVIVPEVVIDESDKDRGYSWHLTTKLYGTGMKTVMVHTTEVYRMSDLT